MNKIWVIVLIIFFGCVKNREKVYLKKCESLRENNFYHKVSVSELKQNFDRNQRIYYLGNDSLNSFFFISYRTSFVQYDKMYRWAQMGFLISNDDTLKLDSIFSYNKDKIGVPMKIENL